MPCQGWSEHAHRVLFRPAESGAYPDSARLDQSLALLIRAQAVHGLRKLRVDQSFLGSLPKRRLRHTSSVRKTPGLRRKCWRLRLLLFRLGALPVAVELRQIELRQCRPVTRREHFHAAEATLELGIGTAQGVAKIDLGMAGKVDAHK